MECKICVKPYCQQNLPHVLNCGHSVCRSCLEYIGTSNNLCPFDRQLISYSNPNFQLMSLINDLSRSKIFCVSTKKPFPEDLCPENHLLSLSKNPCKTITHCNKCRERFSTSSWRCEKCNYDVCHKCKGDVLCYKHHLMIKAEKKKFMCDGCLGLYCESSMRCEECNVDLCTGCCLKLGIVVNIEQYCRKKHRMKFRWDVCRLYDLIYNRQHYICDRCSRKFEKVGSLHCGQCCIDLCVSCA